MEKKVSVVMCTYNGAKYIREQLDSILNQTYPIFEIIIQDDCSTDDTVEIIRGYAESNKTIKLFVNEKQKGVTLNFITALQRASGDLIAISDQDDIWNLEKIEKQVSYLVQQNALLCFSLSKPFTLDSIPLNIDLRVPNYGLERLIFYPVIPGHAMLLERAVIDLLPKDFLHKRSYDGQIAITANAYGKVVVLNEILTAHRRLLNAVSYIKPESNERSINNIIRYLTSAFKGYKNNVKRRCDYMRDVHLYLQEFPQRSSSLQDALHLSGLLSDKSFMKMIKASCLCIKLRNKIFYAKENNGLVAVVRAALWPILCCKYYSK